MEEKLVISIFVRKYGIKLFIGIFLLFSFWGIKGSAKTLGESSPVIKEDEVQEITESSKENRYNIQADDTADASGQCGVSLFWKLQDGVLTISGTGIMYDYSEGVTPWYTYSVNQNYKITKLVMEEGITHIGDTAFHRNTSLSGQLKLPESLISIGAYAFTGCTGFSGEVVIPKSVQMIENSAFADCTGIISFCFMGSRPGFGNLVFDGITADMYYPDNDASWQSIRESGGLGGILDWKYYPVPAMKEGDCGDNLTWKLKEGVLTISGTGDMWDFPNKNAPWYQDRDNMTQLILEEGITGIGEMAFEGCLGFKGTLKLPESVKEIRKRAFSGCTGFTGSLYIPSGVTKIGEMAFYECSGFDGNLYLPEQLTTIERGSFNGCNNLAGDLVIPKSVTIIGDYAFSECSKLTGSLILQDGLEEIGKYAFFKCSGLVGDLIIPKTVTKISDYAFNDCTGFQGTLQLSENGEEIGQSAFAGCSSLTGNLIFSKKLKSIGGWAFAGCTGIGTEMIFMSDKVIIGDNAFQNCTGVNNITFKAGKPALGSNIFYGISGYAWFSLDDLTWKDFTDEEKRNAGGSILWGAYGDGECGDHLKWELAGVTLTISGTGDMWDYGEETNKAPWLVGSEAITELILPDEITKIGSYAFKGCSKIKGDLNIPGNVSEIGAGAFYGCAGFDGSLYLPDAVTSIGDYAFYDCKELKGKLVLSSGLVTIGDYAFYNCQALTGNLIFPKGVTYIGSYSFYNCLGLQEKIEFPEAFTDIGTEAFYGCSGINTLVFKGQRPSFGYELFSGITANAYYPAMDISWLGVMDLEHLGGKLTWIVYEDKLPAPGYGKKGVWVAGIRDVIYNGSRHTQNIFVYDGSRLLEEGKDFSISIKNNLNAYELKEGDTGFNAQKAPYVLLKMKGNYKGKKKFYFRIEKVNLSHEDIQADDLFVTYSGKVQKPWPEVFWNGKKLNKKDFSVKEYASSGTSLIGFEDYSINTHLTLVGKGNFKGEKVINLAIGKKGNQLAISKMKILGINKRIPWEEEAAQSERGIVQNDLIIMDGKKKLQEGIDYHIAYENNREAGIAALIITGTGQEREGISYHGIKRLNYTIEGNKTDTIKIGNLSKGYFYTGKAIEPHISDITFMDKEGKEVPKEAFHISYEKNVNKGMATMIIEGNPKAGWTGTKKVKFNILPANLENFTVSLIGEGVEDKTGDTTVKYKVGYMTNGATPEAEVIDLNGKRLLLGRDYTVGYRNNNKIARNALKMPTAVIVGKGNYSGVSYIEFDIEKKTVTKDSGFTIVVKDKTESLKRYNWKQTFKILDSKGKTISPKEYEAVYEVVSAPAGYGELIGPDKLKAETRVPAGCEVKITVTFVGDHYEGELSDTFYILKPGYDISKVNFRIGVQTYTGNPIELLEEDILQATLKAGNKNSKLTLGKEFRISRYEKNMSKGTAKVTMEGIYPFGGEKTITFKILPRNIEKQN